ncbi:MAG TPA: ATP-binding cassette domain-containing protein, partial [Polyangiaceae bacterium]|nr:ATP-binding cassette domain-containing protein [Polyangiaceae bacterium]
MILLDKVTKRFGPKILFENVSMQFDPGKRYGLTGANGAGKSTLLKMLGGSEETDMGSIEIPSSLRLGILRQNHFEYDGHRIIDTVLMGNKTLWDAMSEKERLLAGDVTDEVGLRLGELEGVIAEEDGYMAESEAGALLEGLGISADKHAEKMTTLPAGYKLRVLIAQVLFGKSDVLL